VISEGSRRLCLGWLGLALAVTAFFPAMAGAVTIDTFPVTGASHSPLYIAASPLGTLWFTEYKTAVREINTAGTPLTTISPGLNSPAPTGDLLFAPDGSLYWAAEPGGKGGYGTYRPNGETREELREHTAETATVGLDNAGLPIFGAYTGAAAQRADGYCHGGSGTCRIVTTTEPSDIVSGVGGAIWLIAPESDEISRAGDSSPAITGLVVQVPADSNPTRAALGPDGDLWVTARGSSQVQSQLIRVTPDGLQTYFPLPAGSEPLDIVLGPDGALWFTEFGSNEIGRMTTAGEYSSCPLPNAAANPHPYGITVGIEGAIWFTEKNAGAIGRLTGGNCVPVISTGGGSGSGGEGGGGSGAGSGGGSGAGGGGNAGTPSSPKPTLSGLALAPASFTAAPSGGPILPKLKKGTGTKVSFHASVAGGIHFTVERKVDGRRVGGRCASATKGNAGKAACSRLVAVRGSFEAGTAAGTGSVVFSGRLSGKPLAAGRYVLVATENAGGATSAPASASFSVVNP
jgi:virginiamycin B lyase